MKSRMKLILLGMAIWMFSGLMIVDTDEVSVVNRLGALNRVENAGLRFRFPWPIESDERLEVTEVKTIVLDKGLSLTGDANLVEVQTNVQYVISDAIQYTTECDRPDLLLESISKGSVAAEIGRIGVDPDSFINRSTLQASIKSTIQKSVDALKLGVRIEAVEIQELNAPSQVIDAFYDLSSARGDKQTLILSAKTYKSKLMPDSRGKASSIREKAKAEAKQILEQASSETYRFNALLSSWQSEPMAVKNRLVSTFWKKVPTSLKIMPVTKNTEVYLKSKP